MKEKRMSRREIARAAQRDSITGGLVYHPGVYGGKAGSVESDIEGGSPPKNKAEGECFNLLRSKGWTVTKRGWPDFFCVKDGAICAVEVKPRKTSNLRKHQIAVMGELSARGIRCYLWSPEGGFEEVNGKR